MKKLNMVPLKRRCGVRGCGNGPQTGKRVFAIARTGEMGPGMAIMCEDCISEAFNTAFPASDDSNAAKPKKAKKDA